MSTYYLSDELKKQLAELVERKGYKNVSQAARAMIKLGLIKEKEREKEIPKA